MSIIGERLKAIIPKAWGDQKALAHRAGVLPETLNRVLSGATKEPGFETIARIARAAGVSLDDLYNADIHTAESIMPPDSISKADRRKLLEMSEWLASRFAKEEAEAGSRQRKTTREADEVPDQQGTPNAQGTVEARNLLDFRNYQRSERTMPRWSEEFPVDPGNFIARGNFDYPLDLHAFELGALEFAAGPTGIQSEPDDMVSAYALHSRDIRDFTHKVIKVKGDSMAPAFCDGWNLLVDTKKQKPNPGDPVAVYLSEEGGIIGYWDPQDDHIELDKANFDYAPVVLGDPSSWHLIGTIQKIVEAPAAPRHPSAKRPRKK